MSKYIKVKCGIIVIFVFVLIVFSGCSTNTTSYDLTSKEVIHFGEERIKELDIKCDDKEQLEVANQIVEKAKMIFNLKADLKDDMDSYGALTKYSFNNPDVNKAESYINLLTTYQKSDIGAIWVEYNVFYYNSDNDLIYGADSILSRWEIEKRNEQWVVTAVDEMP